MRLAIALRSAGRRLGLNRILMSFVGVRSYEDRFNEALLCGIRPGDIVWDVGANVGLYTRIFAGIVGSAGKVFAFEPSPENHARLAANVAKIPGVILLAFGLGAKEERVPLKQGADSLGATSQVWGAAPSADLRDSVAIRVADTLVREGISEAPHFVKIDVEGFELEVLTGMREILRMPRLRGLGVEVHFGLLAERGMHDAPQQIEALLKRAGFACSWPDNSHLIARRGA